MCLAGVVLSVPACLIAAYAPSIGVLIAARILGGLSAGMAYPTTLALITALWAPGPARTKSIALWSALGGAIAALGPLVAGALLEHYWWGSVFLVTLPAGGRRLRARPAADPRPRERGRRAGRQPRRRALGRAGRGADPGHQLRARSPAKGTLVLSLAIVTVAAGIAFVLRQRRAANPLYDLRIAARPTFWVAACAGIIVFGSLMGAMFIGQQFLQNVLDYSTIDAGAAILPAAFLMVIVAPRSAKLVEARGARFTLLAGYVFVLLGFLTMLLLWNEGIAYWKVALGYALVGIGVGFAGTPASRSLTGSVPVSRAGMASGTADLQRDLGGAIMQSIFGALLTAGYASAAAGHRPLERQSRQRAVRAHEVVLERGRHRAQYPQYASQIIAGAEKSFLDGADWAYLAGMIAVVATAVLVFFCFPSRDRERELLARYHEEDAAPAVDSNVAASQR